MTPTQPNPDREPCTESVGLLRTVLRLLCSILILLSNVICFAQNPTRVFVWDGGGGSPWENHAFTYALNWVGDVAPVPGTSNIFVFGTQNPYPKPSFAGTSWGTTIVIFTNNAVAWDVSGGGAITNPNTMALGSYMLNDSTQRCYLGGHATTFKLGNSSVGSQTDFQVSQAVGGLIIYNIVADGDGTSSKLIKSGPGRMWLEGTARNNTYTGGTIINGGRLRLSKAPGGVVAIPGDVTINSGGSLDSNYGESIADTSIITINNGGRYTPSIQTNTTETIRAVESSPANTNGVVSITAGGNLMLQPPGISTFYGVIEQTAGTTNGTLTMQGTGTYRMLHGSNSVENLVVNSGTLVVNNNWGTGAVTVNTGGMLLGTGMIAGAVTVNAGGSIGAGDGVGTLTLTSGLNLSSGGRYVWEMAANSTNGPGVNFDQILLTGGGLVLGGASKLSIAFTGTATVPDVSNPFWQSPHTWTIATLSGSASNPGPSDFTTLENGSYPAGQFTTSVESGNILLNFTPPDLLIISQPVSQVRNIGESVTFSVTAAGTLPLGFQWRFSGDSIPGATTSSYVVTHAGFADEGAYSVVVSNASGSVTSSPATLVLYHFISVACTDIPTLPGDTTNEARALTPDGQWAVGVSGSRGFLHAVNTPNVFNVITPEGAQASILTGVGYRTVNSQREVIMSGLSAGWNTHFMTTNGTAFGSKRRDVNVGRLPINLPVANGLAGTSSDVFYSVWWDSENNIQAYVGQLFGAWPMSTTNGTILWDIKGFPLTVPAQMHGISGTGRAVGFRNSPRQNYVLDWCGRGTPTPWFFNGLDGTTAGEAFSVSADGTIVFGRSPVSDGRTGSWGYRAVVSGTNEVGIQELPNFPDTAGSVSLAVPYGCTADGNYAVGMSYRGREKAVLWDTRDASAAKWRVADLTDLAAAGGNLNLFSLLRRAYSVGLNEAGNLVIGGIGFDTNTPARTRAFVMTVAELLPPDIVTQPASLTVAQGEEATFSVVAVGTKPLGYQWCFNGNGMAGATASSLPLTNVQESDQGLYSVVVSNVCGSVTSASAMLVVNQPPIADASATQPVVISANGADAKVVLDGTRSLDPDGDLLQYLWFSTLNSQPSTFLASGAVAVVVLPVGAHALALVVDDEMLRATNVFMVEVLTTAQAVDRLAATVRDDVSRAQPLTATLSAALASIDRSNPVSAINQLLAFQNQVRAQLAPLDSALAASFIQAAQEIIDVLSGGGTNPGGRPHGRFTAVGHQPSGRVTMQFSGESGPVYLLEASSNLMDWEMIGVALDHGDGTFECEDANAARWPNRFYRVVSP